MCQFYLEGRCKFGSKKDLLIGFSCVMNADLSHQTIAKMSILPARRVGSHREVSAIVFRRSTIKAAPEDDQAHLDRVGSHLFPCSRLFAFIGATGSWCRWFSFWVKLQFRKSPGLRVDLLRCWLLRAFTLRSLARLLFPPPPPPPHTLFHLATETITSCSAIAKLHPTLTITQAKVVKTATRKSTIPILFAQNADTTSSYNISGETIRLDLTTERPIWPLSSYGPGKNAPLQLMEGDIEQSPEEMRVKHYLAMAQGNPQESVSFLASACFIKMTSPLTRYRHNSRRTPQIKPTK